MNTSNKPTSSPIVLVPGYWLGGWVWDQVAARLAELGHRVEAVTLPGLESAGTSRESVRFVDHVDCVAQRVNAMGGQAVLVVHSGAGAIATAVADQIPDSLARIIYVDSGPSINGSVPRPDLTAQAKELPFPGFDTLATQGVSSEGLTETDIAHIETLVTPHPAGACREAVVLHNPQRNQVPATIVCCSIPSNTVRDMAASGFPMFAAVNDLTNLTLIDLPTGHWPMVSRPNDLAEIISTESTRPDYST
jgi:pimeloyl-ACP methyl ester carboxylesterase